MNAWKRLLAWIFAVSLMGSGGVHAQTKTSAQDIQTLCEVSDIPSINALSVSWTGDCLGGKASGVGNVLGFGSGELRYILRGAFTGGRLTRLDDIQDCHDDRCVDKVAPALLRQHSVLFELSQGATKPPASPLSAPPAVEQTADPVLAPKEVSVKPQTAAVPDGPVVEIRATNAVYKGRFTQDKTTGLISGEGRVEFGDGQLFEGQLEAGKKNGRGTYVWSDSQRFTGDWRNDQQEGQGEWRSSRGDLYVGGFRAGKRSGQGKIVYADKSEYEGAWLDDRPSGQGRLKFTNGDVYEGKFVAGEQSGVGVLKYSNGDLYSGDWVNGVREGKGVAQWKDGQRYEGDWRANLKEGQGVMRFSDGGSYEGSWSGDKPVGQGVIKFASGDTYNGQVRDGVAEGKGVYVWGSGDKFEGVFAGGRPTTTGEMTLNIPEPAEAAAAPEVAEAEAGAPDVPTPTVSVVTLCSRAFNKARTVIALRKFMTAFPQDECERHALAQKKIAALEDNERKLAERRAEREAQAKALVGLVVAFRQDHTQCVGPKGNCQNVLYSFEVKGKIREVSIARQNVTLQITGVTLLADNKGTPADLYAQGRLAATEAFRKRMMGTTQTKTEAEVGMEF